MLPLLLEQKSVAMMRSNNSTTTPKLPYMMYEFIVGWSSVDLIGSDRGGNPMYE